MHVITPNAGLRSPDTLRHASRRSRVRGGDVDPRQRRATAVRSSGARGRSRARSAPTATSCCSAASRRRSTSTCCSTIFGDRLRFPIDFVGRGDMSRGGLLLRKAREGRRARLRAGRRRRPARRAAAEAAAAQMRQRGSRTTYEVSLARDDPARSATTSSCAVDGSEVRLTNLRKIFWPELGLTKGDLLQYYADVAAVLLPHIRDRAMVMKRYPHGAAGEFFFMKRAPTPRPDWIRDLLDRARLGQRHRLSDDPGSRRRCCGSSISAASI